MKVLHRLLPHLTLHPSRSLEAAFLLSIFVRLSFLPYFVTFFLFFYSSAPSSSTFHFVKITNFISECILVRSKVVVQWNLFSLPPIYKSTTSYQDKKIHLSLRYQLVVTCLRRSRKSSINIDFVIYLSRKSLRNSTYYIETANRWNISFFFFIR